MRKSGHIGLADWEKQKVIESKQRIIPKVKDQIRPVCKYNFWKRKKF